MDYRRIYDAFIADRLAKCGDKTKRPGMERHHIIPKCMKGSNADDNLVNLTCSDHIFAHLLLARIYGGKLAIAFNRMTGIERYQGRHTRLKYARLMEEARKTQGLSRLGKKNGEKQKAAIRLYNLNRRGQPASPKLVEARRRQGREREGKPAHPKALEAISRTGADRSPAQRARDLKGCAAMLAARYAKRAALDARQMTFFQGDRP
jgi:hypothetical protein